MRFIQFVLLLVLFSCGLAVVTAQNATFSEQIEKLWDESANVVQEARRRRKYPFTKHVWWWGLKALSVLFTIKIKLVLLFLFLGGGIFYGLKVWQGTALGCPEPLIQEVVKHHEHGLGLEGILPYHGYSDPTSYSYGPTGGDLSGIYSSYPGGAVSSGGYAAQPYVAPSYLPPSDSYGSPVQSNIDPTSLPPSRRHSRDTHKRYEGGRQINEETQTIFTDLFFRFLGVDSDVCRRRFVCELEFRNPMLRNAVRYVGVELFSQYVTQRDQSGMPKEFADCKKLYSECEVPKRTIVTRRRKVNRKNPTSTPATSNEETTNEPSGDETSNLI